MNIGLMLNTNISQMSDLCAFIPEERPTNDLMDGGRFWGSRLVKLSAVQHAYLLDAKKPTRVSFKMLMGEYAQALLLGEGKGCELRGDTGQQYFTFDKISMDETITFMGKPIVIDSSKINTYALPCQETAKGFAFEVSEYYNRKGNAIRDFLKHKQWPVLRKWERENSPQEDFFIDQAMDYFTIKSFQIP